MLKPALLTDKIVTQKKSLTSEIIGVFSTNFSVLLLSLITGVITSRILGPNGKGIYTAILVVPLMIRSLCDLGLRQATMFYLGKKAYDEKRYIGSVFGLYILTSTLSISITLALYSLLYNPAYTPANITLALLTLPINLLLSYTGGVFLGKDLIAKFNRQRWIPAVFGLLGVILFVWIFRWGVWGALLALVVSRLIVLFFNLGYVYKEYGWINPVFDFRIISSIVKLGIIYGISLFVIQLNYKVNIILLERLSSADQIGFFSVGSNIANLLWQLPAALSVVILSKSATTASDDQQRLSGNVLKLLRLTLLAGIAAGAVLYFVIPFLLPFVYGKEFVPSVSVVQTILPGVIIMIVFKVLNSRLAGLGKPYYALFVFGPTLLLNIVLDIIFIPKYHAVGAAMVSNVCWLLSTCVFIVVFSRKTGFSLKEMFTVKKTDFNFLRTLIPLKK